MIEIAMVFDKLGSAIFWLSPQGSHPGAIEDSTTLWERIWANRGSIGGVVHTHPWDGKPSPSHTDVTTWSALERALGVRLLWPIVSMDEVSYYVQNPLTGQYVETTSTFTGQQCWEDNVKELRRLSHGG